MWWAHAPQAATEGRETECMPSLTDTSSVFSVRALSPLRWARVGGSCCSHADVLRQRLWAPVLFCPDCIVTRRSPPCGGHTSCPWACHCSCCSACSRALLRLQGYFAQNGVGFRGWQPLSLSVLEGPEPPQSVHRGLLLPQVSMWLSDV